MATNEQEMQNILLDMLQTYQDDYNDICVVKRISTFEEALVLTSNKGLVVRLIDGTEFQITIVRAR